MKKLFLLVALLISALAHADSVYDDRPYPGETFTQFFVRLTQGDGFAGIRLDAPAKVQDAFDAKIFRGYWVGKLNQAQSQLQKQGIDLWGSWYHEPRVLPIIVPQGQVEKTFAAVFSQECGLKCRPYFVLKATPWSEWTLRERASWTQAFAFSAPIFGGKTLVDDVAVQFGLNAADLKGAFSFELLNDRDFSAALQKLGYAGPAAFRTATFDDPANPKQKKILIDDDLIQKMSSFDSPMLRAMEYVGLYLHEVAHVGQAFRARQLGMNLGVGSAEGALLFEGTAELLAEAAMSQAAATWSEPSVLALFVAEQAVAIVYEPDQEGAGNVFPMAVGFPFAAGLFSLESAGAQQDWISSSLKTVNGDQSLQSWLFQRYP